MRATTTKFYKIQCMNKNITLFSPTRPSAGLVIDSPCPSVCVSVTLCHLSHVTCHMSPITCNVSNDRTGDMMTFDMWSPPVRTSLCTSLHMSPPKKKIKLSKKKRFSFGISDSICIGRESLSLQTLLLSYFLDKHYFLQLSFNQKCVLNSLKKN